MSTVSDAAMVGMVVDRLTAALDKWTSDERIGFVTADLEGAIDAAIEIAAGEIGEIPDTLEAIGAIWKTYRDDVDNAEQGASSDLLLPPSELFALLYTLARLRFEERQPRNKRLESIPDLRKQHVDYVQICMIYDWKNKEGGPDLDKLQEELEEPGKHTKDMTSPIDTMIGVRRVALESQIMQWTTAIEAKRPVAPTAPETIATLAVQGVAVSQILTMIPGSTVEQITQACADEEVPVPPWDYGPAGALKGIHDVDQVPAAARIQEARGGSTQDAPQEESTQEGDPNIGQRIQSLARDGLDKGEIAAYFEGEGVEVTKQKIGWHYRQVHKDTPSDSE